MEKLEQQRILLEQRRQEQERKERLERERKLKEVEDGGRAMVEKVRSAVENSDLSGAQDCLKALHKFHVLESIFVTDELRVEEQRIGDAVHELESRHAEMYHQRILLIRQTKMGWWC